MIGSAGNGKTTVVLIIKVIVSLWQSQSWKDNFVLCIEVVVNDWQCCSW